MYPPTATIHRRVTAIIILLLVIAAASSIITARPAEAAATTTAPQNQQQQQHDQQQNQEQWAAAPASAPADPVLESSTASTTTTTTTTATASTTTGSTTTSEEAAVAQTGDDHDDDDDDDRDDGEDDRAAARVEFANDTDEYNYGGPPAVCGSDECRLVGESILNSIDPSVDPCEDFYKFACGNYIKNVVVTGDDIRKLPFYDVESEINGKLKYLLTSDNVTYDLSAYGKMRTFYGSCVGQDAREIKKDILKVMESAGGWPVLLDANWDEEKFDVTEAIGVLWGLGFDVAYPLKMEISSFFFNVMVVRFIFAKDRRSKIEPDYYRKKLDLMMKFAKSFGADDAVAKRDMLNCMEFEKSLAQAFTELKNENKTSRTLTKMNLDEMRVNYSWFAWDKTLQYYSEYVNKSLSKAIFLIDEPNYLPKLKKLMDETPKRVRANYLFFTMLENLVEYMYSYSYIKREDICLTHVSKYFNSPITSLYLKHSEKVDTEGPRDIINNINNQFIDDLIKDQYPTVEVQLAQYKIENFLKVVLGYDDKLVDSTLIEEIYSHLEFDSDRFILMVGKLNRLKKAQSVKNEDFFKARYNLEVNPHYEPSTNVIVMEVPVLKAPYFSTDFPQFINYGRFGSIYAHEVIHALRTNYLLVPPWQSKNENCLINQFNNYFVEHFGRQLDGQRTFEENLANNAGTHVAYHAYVTMLRENNYTEIAFPGLNYTARQMFWISSASLLCLKFNDNIRKEILDHYYEDNHSPVDILTNAVFSNIVEFSQDFQCKDGLKMNPLKKCPGLRRR